MTQQDRYQIVSDLVDAESWTEIVLVALERARNGDHWSRQWLSDQLQLQEQFDGSGSRALGQVIDDLDRVLSN